jgi:hypothetical protein
LAVDVVEESPIESRRGPSIFKEEDESEVAVKDNTLLLYGG